MALPQNTQNALANGADGIEVAETGSIMAVGHDAVNLYRLVAIKHALGFELRTGMKMSRVSALAAAREATGENFRNKQQAYDFLNTLLPDPE
jgi:hypothetical protein